MSGTERAPESVDELRDDDRGRWVVLTEASAYLLNLDERRVQRFSGAGLGPLSDALVICQFENDGEWLELVSLRLCRVGFRMRAVICTQIGTISPMESPLVAGIYDADEHQTRHRPPS